MFNIHNLKKIFLAVFLITAISPLCNAYAKESTLAMSGTRVNVGPHADITGGDLLRMIVDFVNVSDTTITIKEIKIFRPDGTLESPNFLAAALPIPPFNLGPFESKGFGLLAAGILPVSPFPPLGAFQVHTTWESKKPTTGLQSFSVIIRITPGTGAVGVHSLEGFDLPTKKRK